MDGFERKKMQSKENILNATEALLTKYSLSKVSINDIARQAGVSQVTIYNLFGSKDRLIYDCLENHANRLFKRLQELSKLDKSYPEQLEVFFQFVIETSESHPGLDDFVIQNNPQLRQWADQFLERERQIFLEFIKEGQKRGHLNPKLSDESIMAYFEVIIKGVTSNPGLFARTQRNPRLLHDLLLIMLYGFGKPE
jgi:AcrR family transcriptional regulator